MRSIVTINSDITKALKAYNINVDEAKLYLLGIYFNLDTQYISEKTRKQVNALGVVEREYPDTTSRLKIIWKVPLFEEEKSDDFRWIEQWMDGFKQINPSRRGTKSAVTARMKRFFATHPEVRVEDIFSATQRYFSTVQDPQYLKTSHKFIYEGAGFKEVSLLEQFVEQVRDNNTKDGRTSKMVQ